MQVRAEMHAQLVLSRVRLFLQGLVSRLCTAEYSSRRRVAPVQERTIGERINGTRNRMMSWSTGRQDGTESDVANGTEPHA
jgi:hypothetical protein